MKICIVGRGLIGSSAARHLSKAGHDVTLIGPKEPTDRTRHDGVFGSHYDEGRITRLLDPHPVWEQLVAASMARYSEIRDESGVDFFSEVGVLVGGPVRSEYLSKVRQVCAQNKLAADELTGAALRDAFPFLNFEDDMILLHQGCDAGHISPRRLVDAQTRAAESHGAKAIDQVVERVVDGAVQVGGETLQFDRVLVACGAYTNSVLERPLKFEVLARTISFFELDEAQAAKLSDMPSLIYRVADGSDPYVLPPIRYPNGKIYLKIGGEPEKQLLRSPQEMKTWFQSNGSPEILDYHTKRLQTLLPTTRYLNAHSESCAVTYTTTSLPYVGPVASKTFVAAGGCGGAAKSCDEIGRIAGDVLLGGEDNRFSVVFENGS